MCAPSHCPVHASKRVRRLHRRQSLPAEHSTVAPPQAEAEPEAEGGGQDLCEVTPLRGVQRRGVEANAHASGGVSAVSADSINHDDPELRSKGGGTIRLMRHPQNFEIFFLTLFPLFVLASFMPFLC